MQFSGVQNNLICLMFTPAGRNSRAIMPRPTGSEHGYTRGPLGKMAATCSNGLGNEVSALIEALHGVVHVGPELHKSRILPLKLDILPGNLNILPKE